MDFLDGIFLFPPELRQMTFNKQKSLRNARTKYED